MKYKEWLEIWLNNYVKITCKARTSDIYRYRIEHCSQLDSLGADSSLHRRVQAIVRRLEELLPAHGSDKVSKIIKNLVNKGNLIRDGKSLGKVEDYLNRIDDSIREGIIGTSKKRKNGNNRSSSETQVATECDKGAGSSRSHWIDVVLPPIVAGLILIIGLILGCTVFTKQQDTLYYVLESLKDIFAGVVAGACTKKVCNGNVPKDNAKSHRKDAAKVTKLLIVIECVTLALSIVLCLSATWSIFERFMHWNKLAYLWMGGSIVVIEIACTVILVVSLFESKVKKAMYEEKNT